MTLHPRATSRDIAEHIYAPSRPQQGADALWYARQAIARPTDHDIDTLRSACETVRDHSADPAEIRDAWRLHSALTGPRKQVLARPGDRRISGGGA
jgi:hypothetical protein